MKGLHLYWQKPLISDSPLNEGNLKQSSNTSLPKHKILKLGPGEIFFFLLLGQM